MHKIIILLTLIIITDAGIPEVVKKVLSKVGSKGIDITTTHVKPHRSLTKLAGKSVIDEDNFKPVFDEVIKALKNAPKGQEPNKIITEINGVKTEVEIVRAAEEKGDVVIDIIAKDISNPATPKMLRMGADQKNVDSGSARLVLLNNGGMKTVYVGLAALILITPNDAKAQINLQPKGQVSTYASSALSEDKWAILISHSAYLKKNCDPKDPSKKKKNTGADIILFIAEIFGKSWLQPLIPKDASPDEGCTVKLTQTNTLLSDLFKNAKEMYLQMYPVSDPNLDVKIQQDCLDAFNNKRTDLEIELKKIK